MKRTIILTDDKAITAAMNAIALCPREPVHECVIQEHEENRSMRQHRLQWKWNTDFGNHLGMSKREVHDMLKEKFAVPIFIRDDPGYASAVLAVKKVRLHGMNVEADDIKRLILEHTSTTDFKVKQMTEYLNDFERFAQEQGCVLPRPEDLYYEAMGVKRK